MASSSLSITPADAVPTVPVQEKFLLRSIPLWVRSIPFMGLHLACLAVFFTGVDVVSLLLCVGFYVVRMFGITAGYHRYFAHRSYKTSRPFQFVLAWLGCSALQKGPLWWAAHHRHHHKFSDTDEDVHSPITRSVLWSHIGWLFDAQYEPTSWHLIRDWARFPELRWLNRLHWIPGILLAVACYLIGGWSGLVVGFFCGTVLLYHGVFCVNSLCHLFGTRRYQTKDQSRNNWFVALLTLGEGWHNNHHYYQSSANQGFFWYEIDISYAVIKFLSVFGVVWDVRKPPKHRIEAVGVTAQAHVDAAEASA